MWRLAGRHVAHGRRWRHHQRCTCCIGFNSQDNQDSVLDNSVDVTAQTRRAIHCRGLSGISPPRHPPGLPSAHLFMRAAIYAARHHLHTSLPPSTMPILRLYYTLLGSDVHIMAVAGRQRHIPRSLAACLPPPPTLPAYTTTMARNIPAAQHLAFSLRTRLARWRARCAVTACLWMTHCTDNPPLAAPRKRTSNDVRRAGQALAPFHLSL